MDITHALIIDQPWISKILHSKKDWEMRSTHCRKRGYIGLIAKGTGTIVGIAKVTDSLGPFSHSEMIANVHRHQIPEADITSGKVDKWNHAWQLGLVKKLDSPIPYQHKNGAVTWVKLNDQAQTMIAHQIISSQHKIPGTASVTEQIETNQQPFPQKTAIRENLNQRTVIISGGNIRRNHIYLSSIIDFFPSDSIGGSNKNSAAPKVLSVTFDNGITINTDIAGDKKIFRSRSGFSDFFKNNQIKAGDSVVIKKLGRYSYRIERA